MIGRRRRWAVFIGIALTLALPVAASARTDTAVPPQQPSAYLVRAGDTLSTIAARMHLPGGWQQLYQANRPVIGGNPNRLAVGMRIVQPSEPSTSPDVQAQPAIFSSGPRSAGEATGTSAQRAPVTPSRKGTGLVIATVGTIAALVVFAVGFAWFRVRRRQPDARRASWYVAPPVFLGHPSEERSTSGDTAGRAPRWGVSQADVILKVLREGRR